MSVRRFRLACSVCRIEMRVLLLHPEDSPQRGPWARLPWDLIVDLGKSSSFSAENWARQCACPVVRSESFTQGIADAKAVRALFAAGRGHLLDEEGIDWWELMSLLIAPEVFSLLTLQRLAVEISPAADLWATRRGQSLRILESLLNRPVPSFGNGALTRSSTRVMHFAGMLRRFSPAQFKEIILDKYDPGYQWRSRFAKRHAKFAAPVVLVPSAYGNVSRMASSYARLLPERSFLMIATRRSAKQFAPLSNVEVRDLAAYAATVSPGAEIALLTGRWTKLQGDLQTFPELRVLSQSGVLAAFPAWICDGIAARNAWREVLTREPIDSVLCGDDSNLYTRLPVMLAARRHISTVDFHHGALDGRYLLKDLPSDLYLAKTEMERDYLVRVCGLREERVMIGAPPVPSAMRKAEGSSGRFAILFSEPYEVGGMRAEEVYRELLPPLCRLARVNERDVVVKLHPFESRSQRRKIIQDVVSSEEAKFINVIDGPLTAELLAHAWFGITIESSTVVDCQQHGVCCFLCRWLPHSPYDYGQQFARFGVGEALEAVAEVEDIPRRLADFYGRPVAPMDLSAAADPAMLRRWLTAPDPAGARSIS